MHSTRMIVFGEVNLNLELVAPPKYMMTKF